jgi:hypothetical protein
VKFVCLQLISAYFDEKEFTPEAWYLDIIRCALISKNHPLPKEFVALYYDKYKDYQVKA